MYSMVAGLDLSDLDPDATWQELEKADKEKDIDDVKTVCISHP